MVGGKKKGENGGEWVVVGEHNNVTKAAEEGGPNSKQMGVGLGRCLPAHQYQDHERKVWRTPISVSKSSRREPRAERWWSPLSSSGARQYDDATEARGGSSLSHGEGAPGWRICFSKKEKRRSFL